MSEILSRSRPSLLRPLLFVVAGLVVVTLALALGLRSTRNELARSAPAPASLQESKPTPAQSQQAKAEPAPTPETKPVPAGPVRPTFDVVRINPNGDAVVAGRAEPGAEVTIKDGSKEIGRAQADENGGWVFLPSTPLPPGARELTLAERTPDGREGSSEGSVVLVVPDKTKTAAAQPSTPLAVLSGTEAPKVLQAPEEENQKNALDLGVVEYNDKGEAHFGGTAVPGTTIRLYVDDKPVGDAVAAADGRWTLTPPEGITEGEHRIRVDQLTNTGKVAARVERPFSRKQVASREVPPGHVLVTPGQSLWHLARQNYGNGMRYTVIYQANREQIRDPGRIYPGQIFAIPALSQADAGRGANPPSSSKSR